MFAYIDSLERDRNNGGMYDLFVTSFVNNRKIMVYGYVVKRGEDMRIDKIANKIYGNQKSNSFILNLNNILNPLTIKAGDLLIYVEEDAIPNFKPSPAEASKLRDRLLNKVVSDKKQQIDASRKDYVGRRKTSDALPPNIKESSDSPIFINDSGQVKIILGKDLSARPKNSK